MSFHQEWRQIVTEYSFLDMTDFFKVPFKKILRDLNSLPNWREYCGVPRDQREYQSIKSLSVGKKVGGGGFIESQGWKSFSLFNGTGRSRHTIIHNFLPGTDAMDHLKSYRLIGSHRWTELAEHFPSLRHWVLNSLKPYFYPAFIRIAILDPGGMIPPHRDIPPEVSKYLDPQQATSFTILNSFNISLYQKPGNFFCVDGKIIPFTTGSAYWINAGKTHWVVNMSDDIRIHLQIHGLYKRRYREYVVKNIDSIKQKIFGKPRGL